MKIKSILMSLNRKLNPFGTISASELPILSPREMGLSSTPGIFSSGQLREIQLKNNNPEFKEKMTRIRENNMNYMDNMEKDLLDAIYQPINDFFSTPNKIVALINEDDEYKSKILRLNSLINAYLKEEDRVDFEDFKNTSCDDSLPSALSLLDRHLRDFDKLIHYLSYNRKTLDKINQYSIYKEPYLQLKYFNQQISKVMFTNIDN